MENSKQTNIQKANKHNIIDEQDKALFEYETQVTRRIRIRSPRWFDKLFQKTKKSSKK